MKGKQLNDAVAAYKQALSQINDPAAVQGLHKAQRQLKAGQAMQEAVKIKQDFDGKVAQGNQALAQQRYADASKIFGDAVRVLPGDPTAAQVQKLSSFASAMGRGQSALSVKNFPGAIAAFTEAAGNADGR